MCFVYIFNDCVIIYVWYYNVFLIHAPVHGKISVDGLNATSKLYLKEQMEIIGKLSINYTSNVGILPIAYKDVSIKSVDQFINIPNIKYRLNGLKGRTKMQNRESLFKYQSRFYSIKSNNNVKHIIM